MWIARQLIISGAIIAVGDGALAVLGVSLPGLALLFTSIGLIFHIGALYLEPTLMGEWIKASYFGKNHRYKTWDEEYKAYCTTMEKASAKAVPEEEKNRSKTRSHESPVPWMDADLLKNSGNPKFVF